MEKESFSYNIAIQYIPEDEVMNFAEKLKQLGFKEQKSRTGMIMGKMRDCFDSEFYIGEILVSESYVEFKNLMGYGITMGYSVERAFILASFDAIENAKETEILKFITDWFEVNLFHYRDYLEKETKMFKSTKVNFGLMVEG